MLPLRELQLTITRSILADEPGALAGAIVEDGIAFENRLQVYRNNTLISLTEALKATYPVVAALVGEKFFGFAAHSFIADNPPRAPRLAEYGGGFSSFLAAFEPARTLPFLADIARLEWDMNEAHHAADDRAMTAQDLGTVPQEESGALQFELRASCRLLQSGHRIDRLWMAHQPGGSLEGLNFDGGCHLLVYRPQLEVEIMTLDAAGFALLSSLHKGSTLEVAFAAAVAIDPKFDLARSLSVLLARGVFAGPQLPGQG